MDSFTCFGKFGEVYNKLKSRDPQAAMEYAASVFEYGFNDAAIDVSFAAEVALEASKEDIDNSKSKRQAGAKGGRPRKNPQPEPEPQPEPVPVDAEVQDVPETGKNQFLPEPKPVSQEVSEQVSQNPKPNPSQSKPRQTNPDQWGWDSTSGWESDGPAFEVPSLDEVRLFFDQCGCPQTMADKFFYHFDAKGWAGIVNWQSRARSWQMDQQAGTYPGARRGQEAAPSHAPNVSKAALTLAANSTFTPEQAQAYIDEHPECLRPPEQAGDEPEADPGRLAEMLARALKGGEG